MKSKDIANWILGLQRIVIHVLETDATSIKMLMNDFNQVHTLATGMVFENSFKHLQQKVLVQNPSDFEGIDGIIICQDICPTASDIIIQCTRKNIPCMTFSPCWKDYLLEQYPDYKELILKKKQLLKNLFSVVLRKKIEKKKEFLEKQLNLFDFNKGTLFKNISERTILC